MTTEYRRKLIEVALPLDAINIEAAREKSIRHGHPSTLHLWWARRPLAAARAVLFAQLVDDPSAYPDRFPTAEAEDAERDRLFDIIRELVKWENSNNEDLLRKARAEILASCDGEPPPVLDPFAGGGTIPLEAQRLGLEAHASDLNPVAVLINKALIEIPPAFANRPPVNPSDREKLPGVEYWPRATGLAADVRYYGRWMRDKAENRIGHLYPKAKTATGEEATVIAWLWARTVTCPNPACGATMPLVRSFWLGKKKGKEAFVVPKVDGTAVRFEIGYGPAGPPADGTVSRNGATCLVCREPVKLGYIRAEGKAKRMGARLMAVAAEGKRQRIYLPPSEEHETAAEVPVPDDVPDAELPDNPRAFAPPLYGMTRWADLFTPRQLTALTTFCVLVHEAHERIITDGATEDYADAVATYLAFTVSRCANRCSSQCSWDSSLKMEGLRSVFARQALSMEWDYAEGNPFSESSGNFLDGVEIVHQVIAEISAARKGFSVQQDAAEARGLDAVLATDPPYYDNVGYADLADFFYVWLRTALRKAYPKLFATIDTPKKAELVADPSRHAGNDEARRFFEGGFVGTFGKLAKLTSRDHPMSVFYAFKQAESQAGVTASTGWETMLEGMIQAGWTITGTWPMRTELGNRTRSIESNALASSIVLACRVRGDEAATVDRRAFVAALKERMPGAIRELQKANIAPVDLRQSAIGPGMEVFSKHARVLEPDGERMRVRTALGIINQVLDEVLAEQEGDYDPQTRFAVTWFEQHGFDHGRYGEAEVLATARGTAVRAMEEAGILSARGGKVALHSKDELPADWQPETDARVPVWEATMHLVRASDEGGIQAAADLLRRLPGGGEGVQPLAYRLYTICDGKGWSSLARWFNGLVTSWPDIERAARRAPGPYQPQIGDE